MLYRAILIVAASSGIVLHPVNSQREEYGDFSDRAKLVELLRRYYEEGAEDGANPEYETQSKPDVENWTGRWMPDRPGEATPPPKVFQETVADDGQGEYTSFESHRIQMGQKSADCDDAKTNLTVDWDGSPVNYTCYDGQIIPNPRLNPMLTTVTIPKEYVAAHKCMYDSIEYDEYVPTYGTHRPLWPVYGEYKFLPKQRWLHNLEHGAVVMLYHPCANPQEVKKLKALVTGCLRRHVISPYNLLNEQRPLALLTWGNKLTMSYVNEHVVKRFIVQSALRGPEETSRDGDFVEGLLSRAKIVSDEDDSTLCPNI